MACEFDSSSMLRPHMERELMGLNFAAFMQKKKKKKAFLSRECS